MKRPKKLSASFVRTVNRAGRYGDGRGGFGLSLLVKPTTTGRLSKTFSQRLRIHGRAVNVGLGAYPIVTLAEARKVALENRRAVSQGRDPRAGGVPTFAEATERVIAIHRPSWRSPRQEPEWRANLRLYIAPRIGDKRVDAITTADVMSVLLADDLWNRKRVTAKRVRQRIGAVMRWAIAQGVQGRQSRRRGHQRGTAQERDPARPASQGDSARRSCRRAQASGRGERHGEHEARLPAPHPHGLPER